MPRLYMLGSPGLDTSGGRDPLPAARPYQLLGYLACRGTWVSRDVVATLFWPERDTSTSRANLRFVLVQIKRLAQVESVETQTASLRWTMDNDVRRFEGAVAESRWADAISEYGGALLEGFELGAPAPFVEWLQFERARLHAVWHDAVDARLVQLGDDPSACVALAGRVLHADPLDETALSFQLRALAALGRTDDARRAYRDYAQRLATELGIEPSAVLRDLARQIDSQRPMAPASMPAATAPLRDATTPALVGRRVELARLRQLLLGDDCRVLTVSGPGGVGKSLLARAALPVLAGEFAGSAFWIALDDLQTIEQVVPRCAASLDLELRGTESPQQQLTEHLRNARALLVFDNAEHLAGFAAWLGTLLAACDRLKILVTSRARLDLAGEWLLPLEGLPVPDADESETDALRAFDAVRLFEARACRLHPDFDVGANAAEVAALVRIVDGLPLAIELAAVWVRLLPTAEIRRELERSLDLLGAADSRGGRAHSVRDSFEHSWWLLAPAEQGALAQLAVFQGDFSRESARAVADAALPLLAALADKSLLRTTGEGRFTFHPLIRQFALEKLGQRGVEQEHSARTRHAEHFLALLARYSEFHTLDQRAALKAIGAEIENTLAAWRWAVVERRVDLLQICAGALESYHDVRGQQQFGLELFNLAASAIDDTLPAHQFARCHIQLGRAAFCYRRGEFGDGETAARAALQAAQRARYRFGVQTSTNTLGLMLWHRGRMKEAAFCLRDVLRRSRADGDQAGTPIYAGNLAAVERELGNYDEAERLLREALEVHRRLGHDGGMYGAMTELCHLQLDRDRPAAALAQAREGLALCENSGFKHAVLYFHRILADAYFELDELSSSKVHAQSALDAIRLGGDRALEPECRVRMAFIEMRTGNIPAALPELQTAARLALAMQSPRLQIAVVVAFARYCLLCAQVGSATSLLSIAANHPAAFRRQREGAAAELAAMPAASSDSAPTLFARDIADLDQALDRLLTERL